MSLKATKQGCVSQHMFLSVFSTVYQSQFLHCISLRFYVFCLLVVLVKISVLAQWLARNTPLRKPNRGKEVVSTQPRLKSVCDIFSVVYYFIFILCVCLFPVRHSIFRTPVARYSLMPVNTNQPTFSGGSGWEVCCLTEIIVWKKPVRHKLSVSLYVLMCLCSVPDERPVRAPGL